MYSEIYCYGDLLKTIQMAKLNPDSKTFVDMKLKLSPEKTINEFRKWLEGFGNSQPSRDDIGKFVEVNKFSFSQVQIFQYLGKTFQFDA